MCAALRPRRGVCALQCGCGGDALCVWARVACTRCRVHARRIRACVFMCGGLRVLWANAFAVAA